MIDEGEKYSPAGSQEVRCDVSATGVLGGAEFDSNQTPPAAQVEALPTTGGGTASSVESRPHPRTPPAITSTDASTDANSGAHRLPHTGVRHHRNACSASGHRHPRPGDTAETHRGRCGDRPVHRAGAAGCNPAVRLPAGLTGISTVEALDGVRGKGRAVSVCGVDYSLALN